MFAEPFIDVNISYIQKLINEKKITLNYAFTTYCASEHNAKVHIVEKFSMFWYELNFTAVYFLHHQVVRS